MTTVTNITELNAAIVSAAGVAAPGTVGGNLLKV
jgi:hypothetical protein